MTDVEAMVAELIEAGCAPAVAASVVARAFVSGVSSSGFRGIPVDESAEKRRAYDRERKRKSAEIRRKSEDSAETPVSPIENNIKNTSRQNSRGTRIDPQWLPSAADRLLAKQEGLSETETDREAARFRDYWAGRAGAGGVKLDWAATWRNWVRTSAEKLGKRPLAETETIECSGKFYAKFGSEEQDAWDAYAKAKGAPTFPRDGKGGWFFPAQWPPGYKPKPPADAVSVANLRTMQ